RRFYIRRAFRIYPLSIFTVLVLVALQIPHPIGVAYDAPSQSKIWSSLLLIQNITNTGEIITPMWSLPFEVQMYLLLPFIYALGKRFRNQALMLSIAVAV